MKVCEYISKFLEKNLINTIFCVTGGFSMHINDAFGRNNNFKIYYQHHEQACGYSANGYAKTISKPVVVCVTAGCGGTNAVTPCLIAHQDSLPIFFISGQAKSHETITYLNNDKMKLRHYSGQDCDIVSIVKPITKYSYEIHEIDEVVPVFEEAMRNLINGRPGPVWISIPIDIQGSFFKEDPPINLITKDVINMNLKISDINNIKTYLKEAKRPIIIAGGGIKLGNCVEKFRNFINKYDIPVVATFQGLDIIETDNNLFAGRIGLIGDRCGNFSMQNADLLLILGSRMAQGVVGYRTDWFAREAKIIYIDNDENELQKENINYSLKVNMDLNVFFDNFDNFNNTNKIDKKLGDYSEWKEKCNYWKNKWIYEMPNDLSDNNGINPYLALKVFNEIAPSNKNIICASGSILNIIWHMANIKKNDKFIISSQGDMGFELTAAIGSYIGEPKNLTIPIFGEGSLQFNIQELQTIVHHNFPIKIMVTNNNCYGANFLTQNIYFNSKNGADQESGLSFPSTEKIANAYGIHYICIKTNDELKEKYNYFLSYNGPIICEIICKVQMRTPKISAIKNEDGTFKNRPLEDLEPFMDREEFKKEMIIDIV